MDIQSITGANKKAPAAAAPSDEGATPATGFSALLDLVGSQFKATLGLGTMDPAVLKNDANAQVVRPAEPRETKPRPERADDKDAKAKPADDADESNEQTEETAAAGEQKSDTSENTNAETGAEQAVQATIAAAVDVTAIAQAAVAVTAVAAEAVTDTAVETVAVATDAVVAEVAAVDANAQATQTVVDPKAVQQAEVKTAEKVVAPEAIVKDTARVQQAMSAYAPAQETQDIDTVAVEADAGAVEVKTTGKDDAVRTLDVRSAAAQEQANSIARLLGSDNRVQVQVQVGAAHAMKQAVADVSIYNIYAGYSAADAISLANGQFGQAEEAAAQTQAVPAQRTEGAAQTAAAVQAAQHITTPNANTQSNTPARAEAFAPNAIQASASSNGASNANMGFGAFTQSGQSSGAQATQQAAEANPTNRPAATAQHVIDQIKVNITKAAKAGLDRVTITLKPVELGRLEIKLEMSEDHKVRVTVTADNKDTLNLLQTDSKTLERTLNDAGLRTDANNLHFNLRGEGDAGAADGQRGNGGNKNDGNAQAETANDNADLNYDYAAAASARGGVDTFA